MQKINLVSLFTHTGSSARHYLENKFPHGHHFSHRGEHEKLPAHKPEHSDHLIQNVEENQALVGLDSRRTYKQILPETRSSSSVAHSVVSSDGVAELVKRPGYHGNKDILAGASGESLSSKESTMIEGNVVNLRKPSPALNRIKSQLQQFAYDVESLVPKHIHKKVDYTHFGLKMDTHDPAYISRRDSLIMINWLRHLGYKNIGLPCILGGLATAEAYLQNHREGPNSSLLLIDIHDLLEANEPFDRVKSVEAFRIYCSRNPNFHMPAGIRQLSESGETRCFEEASTHLSHRHTL